MDWENITTGFLFQKGGGDTSILHHVFLMLFIIFLSIIMLFGVILMPFRSYYARYTQRGRIPVDGNLDLEKLHQAPILHNSKWAETSWRFFMDYLRNTRANKHQGGPPGGHNPPGRAKPPRRALVGCAHPGPPPVPIFWYISHFDLEKISSGLSGRSTAVSRRNLGRSTFALRRSDSTRETSSRRGKSSPSSSPTTLPSWGGQSPSTSSTSPYPLKP